jgi:hypothetical protein
MTTFETWLDTFIDEKGFDLEELFEVDGAAGWNLIPLGVVVDAIKNAPDHEQRAIKTMLVKIDFYNGDAMDYFRHLAKALAV